MKLIYFLTAMILFFSCRKEERPITPNVPGDLLTNTAAMSNDYRYQLYFNLEKNEFVGHNIKTDWDLAFTTGADDFIIKTNVANAMSVANLGEVDFSSVTDTVGFQQNEKYDLVTGDLDSTAIGDGRNKENLFIVNKGYSFTGQHRGYVKLKVIDYSPSSYSFRIGELSDENGTVYEIEKESAYNFSFFSIDELSKILIEPEKESWDLIFTQYTHIFYDPFTPYLVTGALLNQYETKAVLIEDIPFSEIELSDAMDMILSHHINTVGYNWKTFTDGSFTIHSDKIYIIQDQKGFYYKLRFIDFYDNNGQRGAPKWEYQAL